MRAFFTALVCAVAALAACQDSYSSNAERDTHMGDVHAVLPPSAPVDAAPAPAAPPAVPTAPAPVAAPADH